jgi:gliding motility-associated lipoprotein GldD
MSNRLKALYWIIIIFVLTACKEEYVPKQRGYHRIDLPDTIYTPLAITGLPYTFEHSIHAVVKRDTFGITEPYWINMYYPQFQAEVQITYKDIQHEPRRLFEYINDVHKLAFKHQIRAYSIEETRTTTRDGKPAYLFELSGEVSSQFQFFCTDTTRHFLRGALYFNTSTKNDSLAPVIQYIKQDMMHLLNSLQWKEIEKK